MVVVVLVPSLGRKRTVKKNHKSPQRLYIGASDAFNYLTIKRSAHDNGGMTLFTKVAIPANTRLVVEGKRINKAECDRLLALNMDAKNSRQMYAAYLIGSGVRDEWIDAHPRHGNGSGGGGGDDSVDSEGGSSGSGDGGGNTEGGRLSLIEYIARSNEPAPKTRANMCCIIERQPTTRPVLVTTTAVAADTELTWHYGRNYRRVGYRAGRSAPRHAWLRH